MARKGYRSALNQAMLESDVAFGSQEHALAQLLRQTGTDYKSRVRIERGAARGVIAATRKTIPKVKRDYSRANAARVAAQETVNSKLATLSPIADDIKAASAREAGLHRTQLAQQRASTLGELRSRIVDAKAARQFALVNARQERDADRAKIIEDIQALQGQKGKFTIASARTAHNANRNFRLSKKRERRMARKDEAALTGIDPKTGLPTADEQNRRRDDAPKPKDKDRPTRTQKVAAREKYDRATSIAQTLHGKRKNATEDKIVRYLIVEERIPAPLARAAAQTAFYRGVGPQTRKQVRRRYGLSLPGFPARRPARTSQSTVGLAAGGALTA